MGSAWIVTHENTADLSETSHPKLFQRVQYGVRVICVGDVSARIGERRSKKKYRDIVGSKKRLEEVCEIVLDGELFFYRKEEKEREMFGNIFESTILRILLEVVARFQRDFSALRTIALLTKRWRVVVSIPEIPAQLLREFVRLHRFEWSNALSGTRSPRRFFSRWCRDRYELLFIFYTVRILVFVPSYFTLLRHVCGVVESFFNAGDVWWKIVASLKY